MGKDNWLIWNEEFCEKLKATEQDLGCLTIQREEDISVTTVINGVSREFSILAEIKKTI